MICTCDKCLYTFCSDSLPLTCPDCGSRNIREATMEEKDWYHDLEMEKQRNPLLLDKAVYKAG
ncbi:MAG: hypothetical protein IKE81_09525 [Clostridia bacterium]|nr:hypothetical protein [Clostridia bacterium]